MKLRRAWWLAMLAACDGSSAPGPAEAPPLLPIMGADISSLGPIEAAGATFQDGGQAGDAIAIFRAKGHNTFRLRLFVDPSQTEVEVNDLDYTIALASRIKASGAKFLLDLHYSDTWADPGHQTPPAAWAQLSFDSLENRVESYTSEVVGALRMAGAAPDIVQIGNEIDGGMLWPLGQVGGSSDTPEQWDRLTRLLKAGIRGVKAGLSPGDPVRIMLHYSQGGSASGTAWFFDHIEAHDVPYDLIGLSYYPWWHGSIAGLEANLEATALRYDRDILLTEMSYPWRAGGWEGMATYRWAMTWPISAKGQGRFLGDVMKVVAATPGNHGVGVLWWYPEAIEVPGLFIFGGGSLALFDQAGNLLPAASLFDAD